MEQRAQGFTIDSLTLPICKRRQLSSSRRSYSPFPADLGVNPLSESFFTPVIDPISAANVATLMPVAHLERGFVITNVHLTDFAAPPHSPIDNLRKPPYRSHE